MSRGDAKEELGDFPGSLIALGRAKAREIPSTRDRFPLGESQSNPAPGGRRDGSLLGGPG